MQFYHHWRASQVVVSGWGKWRDAHFRRPTSGGGREASTGAYSPPEGSGREMARVYVGLGVMKEADTLKKACCESRVNFICYLCKNQSSQDWLQEFCSDQKGGRGILIENKRACGKKGLVLGVSVVLPVTLLSRVPSYCCGMANLFTHWLWTLGRFPVWDYYELKLIKIFLYRALVTMWTNYCSTYI